jgi:hypothetical protein
MCSLLEARLMAMGVNLFMQQHPPAGADARADGEALA